MFRKDDSDKNKLAMTHLHGPFQPSLYPKLKCLHLTLSQIVNLKINDYSDIETQIALAEVLQLLWGGGKRRHGLVTQLCLLSGDCISKSGERVLWCEPERGNEGTPPPGLGGLLTLPLPTANSLSAMSPRSVLLRPGQQKLPHGPNPGYVGFSLTAAVF